MERFISAFAVIIAVVALGVAALAWTADDERDACAKLADLGDAIGTERLISFSAEVDSTLIEDCIME